MGERDLGKKPRLIPVPTSLTFTPPTHRCKRDQRFKKHGAPDQEIVKKKIKAEGAVNKT